MWKEIASVTCGDEFVARGHTSLNEIIETMVDSAFNL